METGGFNITAKLAARSATVQQYSTAQLTTPKNRQTTVSSATVQDRSASNAIIEAEYVDFYSPIRPPPEQQNQWYNLIVEGQNAPSELAAEPVAENRNHQLMARYGQHSRDFPLPGSFVDLLV